MKRTLLFVFASLVTACALAQPCTPSWPSGAGPGIMPDSATNLPTAFELQPYSTVVNFLVPTDTTGEIAGTTVDVEVIDITIESVTGLSAIPAASPFLYVTQPGNGVFLGGTLGCVSITGTPADGSAGIYPIVVNLTAHVHPIGTPQSVVVPQEQVVDFYRIVVEESTGAALVDLRKQGLLVYPAVTADRATVSFYSTVTQDVVLSLYNTMGQAVLIEKHSVRNGAHDFDVSLSALPNGNYIATMQTAEKVLTARLSVNK